MKKTVLFKLFALSLALILLLSTACSCKKEQEGEVPETEPDSAATQEELEINAMNVLGEKDLGGETVSFFLRAGGNMWDVKSLYADTILSDAVNDAVYERNERLKSQYNFDISVIESGSTSYPIKIITSVLAGNPPADVVTAGGYDMTKMALQGVLFDLNNINGLNLDKQWWNVTLNDQLSIANTLYYMSGDIICEDNMAVRCLFFNKTMAVNYGFDPASLYGMAEEGRWTMDEMFRMASKCYSDKDGISGKSEGDTFGFTGQEVSTYVFMLAADVRTTAKNADDVPELVLGTGNDTDIVDSISAYFHKDDSVYLAGDGLVHKAFKTNSALFMTEVLGTVVSMRNWDVKFGILPMPKYSTDQASYNHFADGNCLNLLCIPTGNRARLDKIAFVLEAMCIESTNTLNPAFYDKVLRGRYAYDVESTGMLDIILDSMFIENANLFQGDGTDDGWGIIQKELRIAVNEGTSITGVLGSYGETTKILINSTVEKFKDISMAQSYGY